MAFRQAERKKAKLRLGIDGPAGSGKTASSLLIAYGLCGDWSKIGIADTEFGSGELYVGSTIGGVKIGQYQYLQITPPYTPDKYIQAIKDAEEAGLSALILDSLTHAWAGEGGLLDLQGKIAAKSGNSWTAWRDVTPKHNALVDAILNSRIHIIATMRAKEEHVQEKNSDGKTIIRKVGMAPIQKEGMSFEFTIMLDLAIDHTASCSKDRTGLFDGQYFTPSVNTGKQLIEWLETGKEVQTKQQFTPVTNPATPTIAPTQEREIKSMWKSSGLENTAIAQTMKEIIGVKWQGSKTQLSTITLDEFEKIKTAFPANPMIDEFLKEEKGNEIQEA